MNKEDIIKLAREAGGTEMQPRDYGARPDRFILLHSELERFAALVAAAEREACAKVCEAEAEKQYDNMDIPLTIAADLIRARGEIK